MIDINLPYGLKSLWVRFSNLFRPILTARCSHRTKLVGLVKRLGGPAIYYLPISRQGIPEYCHRCLDEMEIPCAWCGESINIGDFVTLTDVTNVEVKLSHRAVIYWVAKRKMAVGCWRFDCADGIDPVAGIWTPPGKVSSQFGFGPEIKLSLIVNNCSFLPHSGSRMGNLN